MNYDKIRHNLRIMPVWVITQRVTNQKSAILHCFAVAAWNHTQT